MLGMPKSGSFMSKILIENMFEKEIFPSKNNPTLEFIKLKKHVNYLC